MNRRLANPATIGDSVTPLTAEEERKIDAYWRGTNYLSVGQIYLYGNPLLREPLKIRHIQPRLLEQWGRTPNSISSMLT
jgi:xylulose-5-phosphate/fructose-6-phosphate phosphoketolase